MEQSKQPLSEYVSQYLSSFKIKPGYYVIGKGYKVLVKINPTLTLMDKKTYDLRVLAIQRHVPQDVRRILQSKEEVILAPVDVVESWEIQEIEEVQVPVLKLLYSDQSAEGTTVEAISADSTVSDAKISGGKNV